MKGKAQREGNLGTRGVHKPCMVCLFTVLVFELMNLGPDPDPHPLYSYTSEHAYTSNLCILGPMLLKSTAYVHTDTLFVNNFKISDIQYTQKGKVFVYKYDTMKETA